MSRQLKHLVPILVPALLLVGTALLIYHNRRTQPASAPASHPTTQIAPQAPQESASTRPAATAPAFATFWDVFRETFPDLPATAPADYPGRYHPSLPLSARYLITEPAYLDSRGILWIARPDAPPAETILNVPLTQHPQAIILTRERVLFADWAPDPKTEKMLPKIVVQTPQGQKVLTPRDQFPISSTQPCDWSRAQSFAGKYWIAPTAQGLSAFDLADHYKEIPSPDFIVAAPHEPAQWVMTDSDLVAYVPPVVASNGPSPSDGSTGALRFADGKWTRLDANLGWTDRLLVVAPLGNDVYVIIRSTKGAQVSFNEVGSSPPNLTDAQVTELKNLAARLNADDATERTDASADLANKINAASPGFAPPAWQTLRTFADHEGSEARDRVDSAIEQEINNRFMNNFSPISNQLKLLTRSANSSYLFYAPQGLSNLIVPDFAATPTFVRLANGEPMSVLANATFADLDLTHTRITHVPTASSDVSYLANLDTQGPSIFDGKQFVPLLPKIDRNFSTYLGEDGAGRLLFRQPQPAQPLSPNPAPQTPTLVIDPNLPNPTPRLPVWNITNAGQPTGWDNKDMPARNANNKTFALYREDWAIVDNLNQTTQPATQPAPKTNTQPQLNPQATTTESPSDPSAIATSSPSDPRPTSTSPPFDSPYTPASSLTDTPNTPASSPSSALQATSIPATSSLQAPSEPPPDYGPLLLQSPDGAQYFDGRTQLIRLQNHQQTTFPLPENAIEDPDAPLKQPWLVEVGDHLYLYNKAGRFIRIQKTPQAAQPLKIQAIFTKNIPRAKSPRRIWTDPEGRIDMVFDTDKLSILFPDGAIPPQIASKMPPEEADMDLFPEDQD